jgi:GntR family transcriptional regulator
MIEDVYRPRYRRIEQVLRERIASLRPGDRLPSDAELQAEFGVSRMTARNAMQRLTDEGLVAREPGRGSFVAEPPTHRRSDRLMTFTQEMRRRGLVPTSQLLQRGLRPADEAEAAALGLPVGAAVVEVRRLRCADGRPIALETAVLVGATASVVLDGDLEHGSLHELLGRAGFALRRGSGTIEAAAATPDDAERLGVELGAPLLVERRVIADAHGRRIEATESRYPADRYALDVRFEVEGTDEGGP